MYPPTRGNMSTDLQRLLREDCHGWVPACLPGGMHVCVGGGMPMGLQ